MPHHEFLEAPKVPFFDRLNNLTVLEDGLFDAVRKGPGVEANDVSLRAEEIDQLTEVAVSADTEESSMKL
jgi:hypothetical protein